RAMVLGIPGDSKDCPKRRMFIRTYGPTAWKRPCDVVVRWNGTKFTYEALIGKIIFGVPSFRLAVIYEISFAPLFPLPKQAFFNLREKCAEPLFCTLHFCFVKLNLGL